MGVGGAGAEAFKRPRGWREQSCPGRGWEFVGAAVGLEGGELGVMSGSPDLSRPRPRLPDRSRSGVSPAVSAGVHGDLFGLIPSGIYIYMYVYMCVYIYVSIIFCNRVI